MLSGFDRYIQIARCFRDEDLRADRQPEFTQIDLEMSFVDQDDVMAVDEGFMQRVFKEVLGHRHRDPLPPHDLCRRPWTAIGSDKPDTRFGLELIDLSDMLRNTRVQGLCRRPCQGGGRCAASTPRAGPRRSPAKRSTSLTELIKTYGAKGLGLDAARARRRPPPSSKFLSDGGSRPLSRSAMGAGAGRRRSCWSAATQNTAVVCDSPGRAALRPGRAP